MRLQYKNTVFVIAAFVIVSASFFVGFYSGIAYNMTDERSLPINTTDGMPESVDFSMFWKVWHMVEDNYVSIDTVDEQQMVWGAISGLVSSLGDPYSVFFPPKENKYFESEIRGNFEGVGMEIGIRDDVLTIIAPLKGTPAGRAGLLASDKIIKIDETSSAGLSVDEAVDLIRGEKGSTVTFVIFREGKSEPFTVSLVRDVIDIQTIETKKRDDGIFVITLYSFSAQSPDLFRNALREFVESGDDKLVLDLRNNPGGYLDAAVDMASWFLPIGDVVVQESFRNSSHDLVHRSRGYDIFNDSLKFVILINEGSASASEIMAGALSEHGKAILVGERSFGKGSVQELLPVTDTTSLKVTVAKWLTPNGVSISENGLTPEIDVSFTQDDFEAGRDPQMDKAIETLKGM